MTTYFHADQALLSAHADRYILGSARGLNFRNGYFDQTADIWSDGNSSGLVVYRSGAPLYFANSTLFLDQVEQAVIDVPVPVRWFVLDAAAITDIDITGGEVLKRLIGILSDRKITFAVSRADRTFRSWLEKYELMDLIDPLHFYPTNRHATAAFRKDQEKAIVESEEKPV